LGVPTYTNPVLAGMHPDPSVCRRGADHYLVCSSFEYWPALPLFHSQDLVHWQAIGHALDRPEQARIDVDLPSGDNGAYAATLRFHDGWFYISGTLVRTTPRSGNFIIQTRDPALAWSDPVWLPHVEGIDPALFFDGGRLFITASRHRPRAGIDWACEVTLQELHPQTFAPLDEPIVLTRGVVQDATAAEAPRLLRRGAYVYLMMAEGGTAQNHAVTVLRAKDVRGPYEVAPHNPILTHRHLGQQAAVQAVGHADWLQTQSGEWWMLVLATRPLLSPQHGVHDLLGRETFLLPLHWENDWPVCGPELGSSNDRNDRNDRSNNGNHHRSSVSTGLLPLQGPAPALPPAATPPTTAVGWTKALGPEWRWLRTPHATWWQLQDGTLSLRPGASKLGDTQAVSVLLRRHQHHHAEAVVCLQFDAAAGQQAGLVVFYNDHHHVQWLREEQGLALWRTVRGQGECLLRVALAAPRVDLRVQLPVRLPVQLPVQLRVQLRGLQALFSYRLDAAWCEAGACDINTLCAAQAGGFVGTHVGLYATGEGATPARFSEFFYRAITGP
jgi:xylan 1,4-beta-xylosidase